MLTIDSSTDDLAKIISELPDDEVSLILIKAKKRKAAIEAGKKRLETFHLLMKDMEIIPELYAREYGISVEEFQALELCEGVE
jgi:hypothetical protein